MVLSTSVLVLNCIVCISGCVVCTSGSIIVVAGVQLEELCQGYQSSNNQSHLTPAAGLRYIYA